MSSRPTARRFNAVAGLARLRARGYTIELFKKDGADGVYVGHPDGPALPVLRMLRGHRDALKAALTREVERLSAAART
jgi:hypothetical protein